MKDHEQMMVGQAANDLYDIKNQLLELENKNGLSDRKIKGLNSGHQEPLGEGPYNGH